MSGKRSFTVASKAPLLRQRRKQWTDFHRMKIIDTDVKYILILIACNTFYVVDI